MENDSSTLMHHLNLQKLAKEMFELFSYLHWLSEKYLLKHTPSSLTNFSEYGTCSNRRVFYGFESKELCPPSLFKKVIKNDSQMFLPTMKYLRSKLRAFGNILLYYLPTFSSTSVLLFHYKYYFCYESYVVDVN